jgi:uncharacterized membrane protein YozB (DUF420 family)
VLSGPTIILTLKILVSAVTVLFVAAVVAIGTGRRKLHGRLNTAFFVLTMTTVVGFELLLRLGQDMTSTFSADALAALHVHLYFAIPSAVLLPVMLLSGRMHWRPLHVATGCLFTVLWVGTFVTGVFFLPHAG